MKTPADRKGPRRMRRGSRDAQTAPPDPAYAGSPTRHPRWGAVRRAGPAKRTRRGLLIAFEGLDQSGKQTQAELLRDRLTAKGRTVRLLSFPDYETVIGAEIGRALRGERHYTADVMQLLYVANRYEYKQQIVDALAAGTVLLCDRYLASSVAYGEAQGLDRAWLIEIQKYLPQPDVTILLDIPPEASAQRKSRDRDKYEQDLALLGRVRDSYLKQAASPEPSRRTGGWVRIDADRDRDAVAADVFVAVAGRV